MENEQTEKGNVSTHLSPLTCEVKLKEEGVSDESCCLPVKSATYRPSRSNTDFDYADCRLSCHTLHSCYSFTSLSLYLVVSLLSHFVSFKDRQVYHLYLVLVYLNTSTVLLGVMIYIIMSQKYLKTELLQWRIETSPLKLTSPTTVQCNKLLL